MWKKILNPLPIHHLPDHSSIHHLEWKLKRVQVLVDVDPSPNRASRDSTSGMNNSADTADT